MYVLLTFPMFDVAKTFGGPVEVMWNLNLSQSVITGMNLYVYTVFSTCMYAYNMQLDVHLSSDAIRGRTVFHIQPESH